MTKRKLNPIKGSRKPKPTVGQIWERTDKRWTTSRIMRILDVTDIYIEIEAVDPSPKQRAISQVDAKRFTDKYNYIGDKR